MKKLIVTVVILLTAWFIYKQYQKGKAPDLAEEYRYAISNINDIAKIRINYRLMDPDITLEKVNGFWQLNNKYRARRDAIENLLKVIRGIELQYIPTPAARTNMIRDLATTGTKVEILDRQDHLLKSYFIGGSTPDERGTFIIMNGSQSPAVVTMTGFEGTIRPYFMMPEKDWRDRMIYTEDYNQLQEVIIEYPDRMESSFAIRRQQRGFAVFPLSDQINTLDRKPRKGAIEAYLQNYKSIGAEAIVDAEVVRENLEGRQPFARILIRRNDQSEYQTAFYPLILEESSSMNQQIERFHLIDSEGDVFLVQHLLFGKLFVDLNNFFDS